jgi:hypothetical protein
MRGAGARLCRTCRHAALLLFSDASPTSHTMMRSVTRTAHALLQPWPAAAPVAAPLSQLRAASSSSTGSAQLRAGGTAAEGASQLPEHEFHTVADACLEELSTTIEVRARWWSRVFDFRLSEHVSLVGFNFSRFLFFVS